MFSLLRWLFFDSGKSCAKVVIIFYSNVPVFLSFYSNIPGLLFLGYLLTSSYLKLVCSRAFLGNMSQGGHNCTTIRSKNSV